MGSAANAVLCLAVFFLLIAPSSYAASALPGDPKFFLDCSNKPPTVSDTQPSKDAECALGSVTSTPVPWTGAAFTISDDVSSAQFQMHGPGVATQVAGTYMVLDVTTSTALAQGTFGPVVLNSGNCANPDVVAGSGTASKGEMVSKDDLIQVEITFTSIFKETVCSSQTPTSTSVSVTAAACDSTVEACLGVPEFGASATAAAAMGVVVVVLLKELRARHLLERQPA
jgi:hypothetical protein